MPGTPEQGQSAQVNGRGGRFTEVCEAPFDQAARQHVVWTVVSY